jgi:hypothetical protein
VLATNFLPVFYCLVSDEPDGVGGWLELPCEVGGCQWWK